MIDGKRKWAIPEGFLKKIKSDEAREWLNHTPIGQKFYWQFLIKHGYHIFTVGTTGSGKTQKAYWLVHWLRYLENQIWVSTGKSNEILPLLCMDRRVTILTPAGCDVIIEERKDGTWQKIKNHPEVIGVNTPEDMLLSIDPGIWDKHYNRVRGAITVLELRNAFHKQSDALGWLSQFFSTLAEWCRLGKMPPIFPATLHIDESQWVLAGKRISGEPERMKTTEVITENALELRSVGIRLAFCSQSYRNIPPAARENMLCTILCHGADISSDENGDLSRWCSGVGRLPTSRYKANQGRFVFEDMDSYPPKMPWDFPLFPLDERDRDWVKGLRVRYVGQHDGQGEEIETKTECLPELGRFSAMAIPPEKIEAYGGPSRYDDGGMIKNEP